MVRGRGLSGLCGRMRGNMTIDNSDDLLKGIMESLDRLNYIRPEDIPNIDLYMDQVTTFMDRRMRSAARYPEEGKILTKTMINNYAKNDLLPPPVKKKYSKEHMMILIFIYYYKSILSIGDIQALLHPITDRFFGRGESFNIESIYREVFAMEPGTVEQLKEDIRRKYARAEETFEDAPEDSVEFLKKFAFICELSFDVYMKKLLIEKLVDGLGQGGRAAGKGGRREPGEQGE